MVDMCIKFDMFERQIYIYIKNMYMNEHTHISGQVKNKPISLFSKEQMLDRAYAIRTA